MSVPVVAIKSLWNCVVRGFCQNNRAFDRNILRIVQHHRFSFVDTEQSYMHDYDDVPQTTLGSGSGWVCINLVQGNYEKY